MKYKHKDTKENFYTLAWTTLNLKSKVSAQTKKTSILACGGSLGEVKLFHTHLKVCFHEWWPVDKKHPGKSVNSLMFHTSEPTWLFCGTKTGGVGAISLWDVGTPTLPRFEGVSPKMLLNLLPDYGDIYNIAWSGTEMAWLLAGTAAGLVGWCIDAKKIKEDGSKYKPYMVDFLLPESEKDYVNGKQENPIVDSLAVFSETTIVAKCANHGLIYMWDIKATTKDLQKAQSKKEDVQKTQAKMEDLQIQANSIEKDATMMATLRWSDTDNWYMNLGCHKGKGLVVCGDDKGSMWLYNMPQMCKLNATPTKDKVEPTNIIKWPELQDDHPQPQNSRKGSQNCEDVIIDKVAVSHDNLHIVAVTSNNMVCIWRRTEKDISAS